MLRHAQGLGDVRGVQRNSHPHPSSCLGPSGFCQGKDESVTTLQSAIADRYPELLARITDWQTTGKVVSRSPPEAFQTLRGVDGAAPHAAASGAFDLAARYVAWPEVRAP